MDKKHWYEERPRIFSKEKQHFQEAGLAFQIDETVLPFGIIRIHFVIEPDNPNFDLVGRKEALKLIAVYPDAYPYFRPQVFAPELDLARHQNPIEKNLCLLGRSSMWWNSSSSLVEHLKEQLPKLLKKGIVSDPETLKNDETEQAEPVSEYYANSGQTVLFDKSAFTEDELKSPEPRLLGTVKMGRDKTIPVFLPRLAVLEIIKPPAEKTGVAPKILHQTFSEFFNGMLYRVPCRPPYDPSKTLSWLEALLAEKGKSFKPYKVDVALNYNTSIKLVTGLCFEEEQQKGENGYGWLFHMELQQKAAAVKKGEKHNAPTIINYYVRIADIDMQKSLRAPKLAPLANKKVGIVGLGALGSFISLELARSGIGALNIMDYDIVEPATSVRWPLGMKIAGQHKASILHEFIDSHYPFTQITSRILQLGALRAGMKGAPYADNITNIYPDSESVQLDQFFEGLSLVVDATTEFGVHHLLSIEATKRNIPYICLYATTGAFGGSVMRQRPGETGCWSCFTHMEDDGKLPPLNEDTSPGANIQPPGCGDVTFTGANVDLQQISLAAVRLAISTLCIGEANGYPDTGWDIARINLFEKDGTLIVPQWQTYTLPVHPLCHYCN